MLSQFSNWLTLAPLWLIAVVVFGGLIGAAVIGVALRRRHGRASEKEDDQDNGEKGLVASAIMGLLALLIAFTFAIAIDRFDTRRTNVLNEANAIGTTYLRAQLLEEPHRARISGLLVRYTDVRLALATTPRGPEQTALLATSDRLIADLWTATVAAFPSMRDLPLSHSFVDTMNNLIDMDSTRKAGRQATVPSEVFLVLFVYLFMAAGVVNYVVAGKSGRRMSLILFFLVGLLLLLIIDVIRPHSGGITKSQEPMLQLRDFMRAQPPESFDRLVTASETPPGDR